MCKTSIGAKADKACPVPNVQPLWYNAHTRSHARGPSLTKIIDNIWNIFHVLTYVLIFHIQQNTAFISQKYMDFPSNKTSYFIDDIPATWPATHTWHTLFCLLFYLKTQSSARVSPITVILNWSFFIFQVADRCFHQLVLEFHFSLSSGFLISNFPVDEG